MNILQFRQPSTCSCAYDLSLMIADDADMSATDAEMTPPTPHLDVKMLSCPTCGRVRFVVVPVDAVEVPLAS